MKKFILLLIALMLIFGPSISMLSAQENGPWKLTWCPNPAPDLAGYRVYRADAPTGPFVAIGEAPATQVEYSLGLVDGYHYWRITAFDSETPSLESDPSNTVNNFDGLPPPAPETGCLTISKQ